MGSSDTWFRMFRLATVHTAQRYNQMDVANSRSYCGYDRLTVAFLALYTKH